MTLLSVIRPTRTPAQNRLLNLTPAAAEQTDDEQQRDRARERHQQRADAEIALIDRAGAEQRCEQQATQERADDADPERGFVSVASPVGRSLVGREEGEEVVAPTPGGQRRFEIIRLITIHDDEQ